MYKRRATGASSAPRRFRFVFDIIFSVGTIDPKLNLNLRLVGPFGQAAHPED